MAKRKSKTHASVTVETMPVGKLLPHPRNPRIHPPQGSAEWKALANSLQRVYFDPLVINKANGYLVSGHLRRKVLESMGITEVDVVVIDVDEKEHLALLMGANNQTGEFDYPQVTKILRDIERANKSQMFFTGFDDAEMRDLLKGSFEVVVDDGPGGVPKGGTTPMVLTSKLKAFPKPVHAMTAGEYERLKTSIQGIGIQQPLNIWKKKSGELVIIDGHQRWKAAKELGLPAVPCKMQGGLNEASALLVALAVNGISGNFVQSEVGRHLGAALDKKELNAKELKIAASFDKFKIESRTPPPGVKVTEDKKGFTTDKDGVLQREMRQYVAGKDYQPLVEGGTGYVEFTCMLETANYERLSNTLTAIDKEPTAALMKLVDHYAASHVIAPPKAADAAEVYRLAESADAPAPKPVKGKKRKTK